MYSNKLDSTFESMVPSSVSLHSSPRHCQLSCANEFSLNLLAIFNTTYLSKPTMEREARFGIYRYGISHKRIPTQGIKSMKDTMLNSPNGKKLYICTKFLKRIKVSISHHIHTLDWRLISYISYMHIFNLAKKYLSFKNL